MFLTSDGNEWSVDAGTYKKGKTYTLKMHDNGTENDITDDVITAIKQEVEDANIYKWVGNQKRT